MAASMDINLQMDQIMSLGRPTRKAKEDANSKIIINDNNNFQHQLSNNLNNSGHLQSLQSDHFGSFYHDNGGDIMHIDMDDGYSNYDIHMNVNQGYNPPTFDTRAKPFDIESINHLEKNLDKTLDNNIGNMGPPTVRKKAEKRKRQNSVVNTFTNGPDTENSLYGAIRFGKVPIPTLVTDWIDQYTVKREPAMLELMQFFVSCCGCKGKITSDIFTQISQAVVIRKLTEEFDEENGEYPLIQNNSKRFKSNFVDFIQVLIRQCQYNFIYDQYLIDHITSLLTVLTDSQVRAFRHTSTLAAMKMMTALVDVTLNISINRENNQRQLEAERNKIQQSRKSGGGMTERLQTLTRRHQELEENMNEVKNMLTFLVKGVFVHRYRDSQPEIRCICMEEIGIWMQRYPAIFLDDSYLKYVGWTLYDRVGVVRAQCLKTLQPLYEERNLVTNLELFTSRFKSRLVDMTLDKDVEVAVQAVKVVSCILKYNETILEDRDCENIYELVYCTNRNLAQAAGEFLNQKLFQIDVNAPITKSRKGKKRSENTPLIRDLVQFFIESELHEHAGYLVDSLWDVSPMIKDWECMVDLLLEDPGKGEQALTSAQESSLIEILYWCVKQASTGESPVGRQPSHHHQTIPSQTSAPGSAAKTGRAMSNKELKAIAEDKNKLTEVLITSLPSLMAKYGENVTKITNIVQLPLFMNLEVYTSGRYERYLDLLIKYLQDLVERHTDQETLLLISQVFELLCADDLSISIKCQTARGTLLDRLIDAYKRSYSRYYGSQTDEPSQDDAYSLHSAIKRLGAFYACHNLRSLDLWDSLIRICQSAQNQAVFHEEIVAHTISTCHVALTWQLTVEEGRLVTDTELLVSRTNLHTFMKICHSYLDHQSSLIAQESYSSICDLLVVCSRHLLTESPELEPLVYQPDTDLQNALIQFLEQRVFVEDDADEDENVKIEELHNRRTNLAMFFKLIVYNVLAIRAASSLYKFYLRFFNDFGDIMKYALAKSREINRVHTSRMVMECLTCAYRELLSEQSGTVERSFEGFVALKELARRLNLSFGLDLVKIREAMIELHKMAIDTVYTDMVGSGSPSRPPPTILVLELAAEFSNKLLGPDKKLLLDHVTRTLPGGGGGDTDDWASLHHYKVSLDPDAMDAASAHGDSCHSGGTAGATTTHHSNTTNQSLAALVLSNQPRPRGRPKKMSSSSTAHAGPIHSTAIKKRRLNHSMSSTHSINVSSIAVPTNTGDSVAQVMPPQQVSSRGRILKNRTSIAMAEQLSHSQ